MVRLHHTGVFRNMFITTAESPPGYHVTRTVGMFVGVSARNRNVGTFLAAVFRFFVGGEPKGYLSMLEETRTSALDRLGEAAARDGANAVFAVRFDSSDVGNGITEVVAYGTGVVIDGYAPIPEQEVSPAVQHASTKPQPSNPAVPEAPPPPASRFY